MLLLAGIVLAALNLRPALASISPVLGEIMADLGLTPAAGGLITTVMVVCLGVAAPLAPLLARRIGLDRTLLVALAVLTAGLLVRSSSGTAALYLGAVIAGSAIAVMNVVMPGVVKRHFPEHVGPLTGAYVTALALGAALASGLTAPLADATGGWRGAAASGAVLSAAAVLLWLPQARRDGGDPAQRGPFAAVLTDRVAWQVAGFMGLQSMTYFVALAWLPTLYQAAGLSAVHAGFLLGLSNLSQVITTLTVPVLAARARAQSWHIAAAAAVTAAGYLGVLLAPAAASWLWAVLIGLGTGASIALALLIITLRAEDSGVATSLSAIAQTFGYTLAALGPVLVGVLRQVSGGWTVPLLVTLGVLAAQLWLGIAAGRPQLVGQAARQKADRLLS